MTVTEEEARNMWCPFSRVMVSASSFTSPASASAGYNRALVSRETVSQERGIHRVVENVPIPSGSECIGSRCMAWRTEYGDNFSGRCGLVPEG